MKCATWQHACKRTFMGYMCTVALALCAYMILNILQSAVHLKLATLQNVFNMNNDSLCYNFECLCVCNFQLTASTR